jgi:tRNA pseudouridine55 synthase
VGGQRAYAAARGGSPLALAERPVVVHELKLAATSESRLRIEVRCGPGTYIRSIARDIGNALGCGAHLSALRRTRVGAFDLSKAVTLSELADAATAGAVDQLLLAPDEGINDMAVAILGAAGASSFAHGISLEYPTGDLHDHRIRIYDIAGSFFGVGEISDSRRLKPLKVLANSR